MNMEAKNWLLIGTKRINMDLVASYQRSRQLQSITFNLLNGNQIRYNPRHNKDQTKNDIIKEILEKLDEIFLLNRIDEE